MTDCVHLYYSKTLSSHKIDVQSVTDDLCQYIVVGNDESRVQTFQFKLSTYCAAYKCF